MAQIYSDLLQRLGLSPSMVPPGESIVTQKHKLRWNPKVWGGKPRNGWRDLEERPSKEAQAR